MNQLEIEVKFCITGFDAIRNDLKTWGHCIQPQVLETNICLDDANQRIRNEGGLLRLRQDEHHTLTLKLPPAAHSKALEDFKVFSEFEVRVSDIDAMQRILRHLGYQPQQVYEKKREIFQCDGIQCCLDQMPFGNFLELEGAPEKIMAMARQLGLDWRNRILSNYLAMFAQLKQHLNLPFNDITFFNFAGIRNDLSDYWRRFEVSADAYTLNASPTTAPK